MRTTLPPRLGMIDAIAAGLRQAVRRPWLWAFPAVMDLILWLAPRFSLEQLGQRLMVLWKAMLPMAYSPAQIAAMQDVVSFAEQSVASAGKEINLLSALSFGWLTPPSALSIWQPTRFTLISDGVLAPLGLGVALRSIAPPPLQPAAVQIGSVGGVLLLSLALFVVGQLVVALYYRVTALGMQPVADPAPNPTGRLPRATAPMPAAQAVRGAANPPSLARLTWRVSGLSIIAALSSILLTLPLGLVGLLAQLSGGTGVQLLLAMGGGFTLWLMLWFLSALFFVGDALTLEGLSLGRSLFQGLALVRANGFRTLIFAALVNLIMLGARALWGIIGGAPLGALTAMLLNAYLATGMLISIFAYYGSLRRAWQAARAAGSASV